MDEMQFYQEMHMFLRGLHAETDVPVPTEIGRDDNLFDLGLVNSFSIIRMIVFVEELTGRAIDLDEHEMESFYTLRGLHQLATVEVGSQC